MKITALILASAITAAPPVLEPAAMHLATGDAMRCLAPGGCVVFNVPGLEAAIQDAYDAGAREKCGRAI